MRRIAVCVLSCLLAACGFHPMYADNGKTAKELAEIRVATIADRQGQVLRNLLIDKINRGGYTAAPRYELAASLDEQLVDLGIRKDATASWAQLNLTAHYRLTEAESGKTLLDSYAKSTVSYSKLDAQYANLAGAESAKSRALNELSEQILRRVSLYFSEAKTSAP